MLCMTSNVRCRRNRRGPLRRDQIPRRSDAREGESARTRNGAGTQSVPSPQPPEPTTAEATLGPAVGEAVGVGARFHDVSAVGDAVDDGCTQAGASAKVAVNRFAGRAKARSMAATYRLWGIDRASRWGVPPSTSGRSGCSLTSIRGVLREADDDSD